MRVLPKTIPRLPFWTEQEANDGYGYITMNILNCTDSGATFGMDLMTGKILQCLQAYPLNVLQQILSQVGILNSYLTYKIIVI